LSVDSVLDEALTILLAKAQRTQLETTPQRKPAMIEFEWTGGGAPIVLANCDPVLNEVPFPGDIVWAHMWAGDAAGNPVAVTATITVGLTQILTFGASTSLHGSGSPPSLVVDSATNASITGWQTHLVTGDTLIGVLTAFTGLATWVALTILVRPTTEDIGVQGIADANGDQIVDEFGNLIVLRS
jgi:hypothetical protein